jgi:prevent-host-death family protein
MVTMHRVSLVHAKAHLSELVDLAEHKKKAVIILRHGKPAAAIVPLDAVPALKRDAPRPMSAEQASAFMDRLVAHAPPDPVMNIEEALGRNRLDRL